MFEVVYSHTTLIKHTSSSEKLRRLFCLKAGVPKHLPTRHWQYFKCWRYILLTEKKKKKKKKDYYKI